MSQLLNVLQKHSGIGAVSGIGAAILPLFESIAPYLQFAGMVLGVALSGITLILKIREFRNKEKKD